MTDSTDTARPRKTCPQCGETVLRVRRRAEDRQPSLMAPMRRYSCTAGRCDWQGLLPVSHHAAQRRRRRRMPLWRQPGPLLLLGLTALGIAVGTMRWVILHHSPAASLAGLALGESHDGVPLPPSHPLRRQLALAAAATVQPAAASAAIAEGAAALAPALALSASSVAVAGKPLPRTAPLELRQGCAWGQPGRSPYRGTVEEALAAAHVPQDVVRQIAYKVKTRQVADRLEIRTSAIRSVALGRQYEPRSMAMSFGRTLCLQTRVNFVAGHVERADLYEAADASGRKYAVMVPDVCGNVSVLGARGEREDPLLAGADLQGSARSGQSSGDGGGASKADPEGRREVPEPGTLLLVLAAAAALWAAWRRRGRP